MPLPTPSPPTQPEADGTLAWDATTLVVVRSSCGRDHGHRLDLRPGRRRRRRARRARRASSSGAAALDVPPGERADVAGGPQRRPPRRGGVRDLRRGHRAVGPEGPAARAAAASAARVGARVGVPVYGSGGFTTYDDDTAASASSSDWVDGQAIPRVKIKIGESWGTEQRRDLAPGRPGTRRHRRRRRALRRRQRRLSTQSRPCGSLATPPNDGRARGSRSPSPPTTSTGCARCATRSAADVAAGEYGYDLPTSRACVRRGAVDCLQVDVTRCGGARPSGCAPPRSPQRTGSTSPRTARRTLHAARRRRRPRTCVTSSGSTTTSASSDCSSTAPSTRQAAASRRTRTRPASASSSAPRTRRRTEFGDRRPAFAPVPSPPLRLSAAGEAAVAHSEPRRRGAGGEAELVADALDGCHPADTGRASGASPSTGRRASGRNPANRRSTARGGPCVGRPSDRGVCDVRSHQPARVAPRPHRRP